MYTREIEILNAIANTRHRGITVPEIALRIHRSETIVRKWLYRYTGDMLAGVVEFKQPGKPALYVSGRYADLKAISIARTGATGAIPALPAHLVENMLKRHYITFQRVYTGAGEADTLEAYFPTHDGYEALEAADHPFTPTP